MRRWALLLLPGGLAAGHLLGYAATDSRTSVPPANLAHDALHLLLGLAVPLSLVLFARILVGGARRERVHLGFGVLARQQVVAFVVLEIAEHAATGTPPTTVLLEPTTLFGILAQLVVAAILALTLGAARAVGQRFATRSFPFRPRSALAAPAPASRLLPMAVSMWSLSRRGPPLTLL